MVVWIENGSQGSKISGLNFTLPLTEPLFRNALNLELPELKMPENTLNVSRYRDNGRCRALSSYSPIQLVVARHFFQQIPSRARRTYSLSSPINARRGAELTGSIQSLMRMRISAFTRTERTVKTGGDRFRPATRITTCIPQGDIYHCHTCSRRPPKAPLGIHFLE